MNTPTSPELAVISFDEAIETFADIEPGTVVTCGSGPDSLAKLDMLVINGIACSRHNELYIPFGANSLPPEGITARQLLGKTRLRPDTHIPSDPDGFFPASFGGHAEDLEVLFPVNPKKSFVGGRSVMIAAANVASTSLGDTTVPAAWKILGGGKHDANINYRKVDGIHTPNEVVRAITNRSQRIAAMATREALRQVAGAGLPTLGRR